MHKQKCVQRNGQRNKWTARAWTCGADRWGWMECEWESQWTKCRNKRQNKNEAIHQRPIRLKSIFHSLSFARPDRSAQRSRGERGNTMPFVFFDYIPETFVCAGRPSLLCVRRCDSPFVFFASIVFVYLHRRVDVLFLFAICLQMCFCCEL